jgi:hypothetical protein
LCSSFGIKSSTVEAKPSTFRGSRMACKSVPVFQTQHAYSSSTPAREVIGFMTRGISILSLECDIVNT